MLKMTVIELELTSNIELHLFIKKGLRAGISYISKRHKANDKYMECYNSSKKVHLLGTWKQKMYIVGQGVNISPTVYVNV